MVERHRQDAVDGIEYSIYTHERSSLGYALYKVPLFKVTHLLHPMFYY